MNRLIIVGNGFDLAHNMKTSYQNFIDDYWSTLPGRMYLTEQSIHSGKYDFVKIVEQHRDVWSLVGFRNLDDAILKKDNAFSRFMRLFNKCKKYLAYSWHQYIEIVFLNKFFERLSFKLSLQNWVDIEMEYYHNLKEISALIDEKERSEQISQLNTDFAQVKRKLEEYLLREVSEEPIEFQPSIASILSQDIVHLGSCCSDSNENRILGMEPGSPENTMLLNFNYTNTFEKLYKSYITESVCIHGQLNDTRNPIIFGYGDEMDSDYGSIESLGDNRFLDNIKSMNYMMTGEYDRLQTFLASDYYQVLIMGHSCGISDRLLLNDIMDHQHCVTIQIAYYQYEKDGEVVDDYKEKVMNISRVFNNKQDMRKRIINHEYSFPLIPAKERTEK